MPSRCYCPSHASDRRDHRSGARDAGAHRQPRRAHAGAGRRHRARSDRRRHPRDALLDGYPGTGGHRRARVRGVRTDHGPARARPDEERVHRRDLRLRRAWAQRRTPGHLNPASGLVGGRAPGRPGEGGHVGGGATGGRPGAAGPARSLDGGWCGRPLCRWRPSRLHPGDGRHLAAQRAGHPGRPALHAGQSPHAVRSPRGRPLLTGRDHRPDGRLSGRRHRHVVRRALDRHRAHGGACSGGRAHRDPLLRRDAASRGRLAGRGPGRRHRAGPDRPRAALGHARAPRRGPAARPRLDRRARFRPHSTSVVRPGSFSHRGRAHGLDRGLAGRQGRRAFQRSGSPRRRWIRGHVVPGGGPGRRGVVGDPLAHASRLPRRHPSVRAGRARDDRGRRGRPGRARVHVMGAIRPRRVAHVVGRPAARGLLGLLRRRRTPASPSLTASPHRAGPRQSRHCRRRDPGVDSAAGSTRIPDPAAPADGAHPPSSWRATQPWSRASGTASWPRCWCRPLRWPCSSPPPSRSPRRAECSRAAAAVRPPPPAPPRTATRRNRCPRPRGRRTAGP